MGKRRASVRLPASHTPLTSVQRTVGDITKREGNRARVVVVVQRTDRGQRLVHVRPRARAPRSRQLPPPPPSPPPDPVAPNLQQGVDVARFAHVEEACDCLGQGCCACALVWRVARMPVSATTANARMGRRAPYTGDVKAKQWLRRRVVRMGRRWFGRGGRRHAAPQRRGGGKCLWQVPSTGKCRVLASASGRAQRQGPAASAGGKVSGNVHRQRPAATSTGKCWRASGKAPLVSNGRDARPTIMAARARLPL